MRLRELISDGNDDEQPTLADEYEAVDWDSDDSGVAGARINWQSDRVVIDYELEEVRLDVHTHQDGVNIVFEERSGDHWRGGSLMVDADEAETLAAQLELAAELLRDGKDADIRV